MPMFRCVERAAVGYSALHLRPSAWGPMNNSLTAAYLSVLFS